MSAADSALKMAGLIDQTRDPFIGYPASVPDSIDPVFEIASSNFQVLTPPKDFSNQFSSRDVRDLTGTPVGMVVDSAVESALKRKAEEEAGASRNTRVRFSEVELPGLKAPQSSEISHVKQYAFKLFVHNKPVSEIQAILLSNYKQFHSEQVIQRWCNSYLDLSDPFKKALISRIVARLGSSTDPNALAGTIQSNIEGAAGISCKQIQEWRDLILDDSTEEHLRYYTANQVR